MFDLQLGNTILSIAPIPINMLQLTFTSVEYVYEFHNPMMTNSTIVKCNLKSNTISFNLIKDRVDKAMDRTEQKECIVSILWRLSRLLYSLFLMFSVINP